MRDNKIHVGTIFYKVVFDPETELMDKVEYYRLTKLNNDKYSLKDEKGETKTYTDKELNSLGFKAILPDGIMLTSIINTGGHNDVITELFRMKDLAESEITEEEKVVGTKIPRGAICRQKVNDIFSQIIDPDTPYYGLSISEETCPANVNYTAIMACDQINEKSTFIMSVYKEDTLDTLMGRIPKKYMNMYDEVLMTSYIDHAKDVSANLGGSSKVFDIVMSSDSHEGYVKTYRRLLETNNFMFNFYAAFDVIPVNLDLENKDHYDFTEVSVLDDFSRVLCKNIIRAYARKYVHHISARTNNYFYIMDNNDNLYVVLFKEGGEYHIPVEEEMDSSEIAIMAKAMGSKSVLEAYSFIRQQDTSKYKK